MGGMWKSYPILVLILIFTSVPIDCEEEDDDLLDLLLPYKGEHGPHKTHLQIRSVLDDDLYVTFPSSNNEVLPLIDSQIIVRSSNEDCSDKDSCTGTFTKYLAIRVTTLEDPLHTFSVFEPGGDGGCTGDHRTKVTDTARLYGCLAASNAGFFNTATGACYGNIASDGRLLQNSVKQNVNFGIRQDGTIVVGYLSEEDITTTVNPFVNLVSGVIWVVRDGANYVRSSANIEDMSVQETGDTFINTISARTALGHDAQGRLVLVHVTGKTGQQGLNLYDLADFLVSQGVINAINLDGGGSMTSVINGTLVSVPSDLCPDRVHRCERKVTTIVCFHEPFCKPKRDCDGHGKCNMGECECTPGWSGPDCSLPEIQPEQQPEIQPEQQPEIQPEPHPENNLTQTEIQPEQQLEILPEQTENNVQNNYRIIGSAALVGVVVGLAVAGMISFGVYLVKKRGYSYGMANNRGENASDHSLVEMDKEEE